jgi:phage minor structural protein, N-terminal domain protein|nr:MAG TPA: tail protein [Caudoviricetes sp.]
MLDNGLIMSPIPDDIVYVYDQNYNLLGASVEIFSKMYEDEIVTRARGKEVFTFESIETSSIYQHLKVENIISFGGRWFRIKYAQDVEDTKGLTKFTCYALWYELAEGLPRPLKHVATTVGAVAQDIIKDAGKWVQVVCPPDGANKRVRSITAKENSMLWHLRYLAKQYNLEITFGYEELLEQEVRIVRTVVFLQPYTESKVDFPLVVEENLKYVTRQEDSRNLCTAYKLTGKKEEGSQEPLTFASINNGSDYLIDVSWFTARQMRPRYIAKSKSDERFKIKENLMSAARAYLDIYCRPLIGYEASAVLYKKIPDLHHTQLIVDDHYSVIEWRKISSRKIDYDDLSQSVLTFQDPRRDLMDLLNEDGEGVLAGELETESHVVIRYADDILGTNFNAESGKYIGVISTTKHPNELVPDDFTWVKLQGPEGPQGEQGSPGRDGVDGVAGKNGVGIADTSITYAVSVSGTQEPESGWSEQVPELIKGRFLWTKTFWRYTDGAHETGYSVAYIGQDGNTGKDGIAGKDGVGIAATEIMYASSNSSTVAPAGGWSTQVPTVPQGHYLWTRTTWRYTDKTTETGYSVSRNGQDGAKGDPGRDGVPGKNGLGLKNTSVMYGISMNDTVQPGSWTSQVPALIKGQYLWTRTIWTYTDNTNETGYQKTYIPRDGNNGRDGIAGKDGVGIKSTTITYAGSTSGTVPPTTNWTSNIPNVQPGFFLWTKTVWTYTDNTSETGYSISKIGETGPRGLQGLQGPQGLQGIPGATGRDGRSQYTHIAFSDSPNGEGFSHTDQGRAYIGQYQDFNPEHSKDPAAYRWTKWKGNDGAQGIPGKPGVDGKTNYFHIAYASSADGSREFSLEDNNQQYMGYYSDYTQADSRDRTKYKWFDRLANIQVGSQNLLRNTATLPIKDGVGTTWNVRSGGNGTVEVLTLNNYPVPGILKGIRVKDNTNNGNKDLGQNVKLIVGQRYTMSCWARVSPTSDGPNVNLLIRSWTTNDTNRVLFKTISNKNWVKYSLSFTADTENNGIQFGQNGPGNIEICGMKLELGNVPTDWSLAMEDIQSQLDEKANQKLTDQQLLALTEKTQLHDAELKAKATMEQLSNLEKAYEGRMKANEEAIKESEADLILAASRIEATIQELGGLRELKKFVDSYMSSSNEGLIIGKNDGSSTIKVSSDRISMFSAGKEVMYLTQGVIHIDNGIFTRSIQVGRFRTEQYSFNPDMNVIRYVG